MGYRRKSKVLKLVFADPEMEGLEVRAKSVSVGTLLKLTRLADTVSGAVGKEELKSIDDLFSGFAKALVSWNLETEGGEPVPATVEGMYEQELPFMLNIIVGWMDAATVVSDPLAQASSGGAPFPEESIPMEVSSLSPIS